MSFFDETIERIKSSKRRRKQRFNTEETDQTIIKFLFRMDSAAQADVEANKNSFPATHKLLMLPDVVGYLSKVNLMDQFLQHDALGTLRRWLEPLPDGSLPNENVRHAVLDLLLPMPVTTHQLRTSGIGRAINFLYKHHQESRENKRIASELITKWSRPIFGLSESYEELADIQTQYDDRRRERQRQTADRKESELERKLREKDEQYYTLHARIPQPSPVEFIKRPVSQVVEKRKKVSTKKINIEKALLSLRQKSKKKSPTSKIIRMSIEGKMK